jgi:hypothetical protein
VLANITIGDERSGDGNPQQANAFKGHLQFGSYWRQVNHDSTNDCSMQQPQGIIEKSKAYNHHHEIWLQIENPNLTQNLSQQSIHLL